MFVWKLIHFIFIIYTMSIYTVLIKSSKLWLLKKSVTTGMPKYRWLKCFSTPNSKLTLSETEFVGCSVPVRTAIALSKISWIWCLSSVMLLLGLSKPSMFLEFSVRFYFVLKYVNFWKKKFNLIIQLSKFVVSWIRIHC